MNVKTLKDLLADVQAKSDGLPAGTVLVPPAACQVCGAGPCNAVNHNFGVCPICHRTSDYLNVGNDHWFVCNEHKTKWVIGANLFSSCMDETPEQQRAEQEKIGFASYEKVAAHYDTTGADEESDGCHCFRCENSDVREVQFGDPELMRITSEEELIEEFVRSYPYQEFDYICRKLRLPPAEALKRILPLATEGNAWYTPEIFAEDIKKEAAGWIEAEWEPGTPPSAPMTKAEVFTLFAAILKVELKLKSSWSIYDMAYRTGMDVESLASYFVDYVVTHVLSTFKYLGGQKWLLSPEEIQEAAVHCEWTRTGSNSVYNEIREKQDEKRKKWEEQQTPEQREKRRGWWMDHFPTKEEIQEWDEEQKKWKWPFVPYVDYCSTCGVFFTGDETACTGCGALRMYKDPRP
jgi:hypothetical protein